MLPGVGAFADCKRGLASLPGMIETLNDEVIRKAKPFLGICVGMQLMATRGLEFETVAGLGWIPGDVKLLTPSDPSLKIPHMGWNQLQFRVSHPVFAGIAPGAHAYFVHSYGFDCAEPTHVLATVDYGGPVTAAIGRDNLVGTQFHPEKSQETGLRLLDQFPALAAMILYPAIDLKGGQCVRLLRGDMDQATVFNTDPAAQAREFVEAGRAMAPRRRSRRRVRRQGRQRRGGATRSSARSRCRCSSAAACATATRSRAGSARAWRA